MSHWNDFNNAEQQSSYELIPKGTLAKVRMTLKPGGFDDEHQGWTGGWATQNQDTGAVYLSCEFVVLEGEFAKRKLWSLIGLYSPKGPMWAQMGRSFVRALLNSANRIDPNDQSVAALAARQINGIEDLDGVEFVARIEIEKDSQGHPKNVIKSAIEPGHAQYTALMSASPMPAKAAAKTAYRPPVAGSPPVGQKPASQPAAARATAGAPHMAKPSWAQ
jgi:hypothetical protein